METIAMYDDLHLAAVLPATTGTSFADADTRSVGSMRKVGGILTGQLSGEFTALEARFMSNTAVCVSCRDAERAEGRLRCGVCRVAQRPAKLSAAQRQALKDRALAIGRARPREGHKAGRFDLWV